MLIDLLRGGVVGRLRPDEEPSHDVDRDAGGLRRLIFGTDAMLGVSDTWPLRLCLGAHDGNALSRE